MKATVQNSAVKFATALSYLMNANTTSTLNKIMDFVNSFNKLFATKQKQIPVKLHYSLYSSTGIVSIKVYYSKIWGDTSNYGDFMKLVLSKINDIVDNNTSCTVLDGTENGVIIVHVKDKNEEDEEE